MAAYFELLNCHSITDYARDFIIMTEKNTITTLEKKKTQTKPSPNKKKLDKLALALKKNLHRRKIVKEQNTNPQ